MAGNKLIDELIIKVKQKGAKPTENAIRGVGEALDDAKKSTNAFNAATERTPKYLERVEKAAERTAAKLSKVKLNFSSAATENSLSAIESSLEALIGESLEMNDTMSTMSKNLITLFENLSTNLGADLERVEDGLIDVRVEAGKTGEALVKVGKGASKSGRGMANQNRQGRNQARTFSDIAKFAGPLPLLYANIAANVFALSEAFRLITEGEQLNRLEQVGTIIGAQIGQPVQFTAIKMQELTGHTLNYGDALRNAAAAASYGFDSEQVEQLTMAARRASIALGVDMQDAMNRVIRGTSKLEIELLDELGITTKLTTAYEHYAQKIGVSANALNSYQQRAALVNEINQQSIEKFGVLDELLRDGAPWETFGANSASAFQTLLKSMASATSGIAEFFNTWAFGDKTLSAANTKAQMLGETLAMAFEQDGRAGMIGGLREALSLTEKYESRLSNVLNELYNPKEGSNMDAIAKEAGFLRSAITRLKNITEEYSIGSVKDLAAADLAYKNLNSTVKGSVPSYGAAISGIKGQSVAYEKLYTDVTSMQKAYYALKAADPAFDAAKALTALGFSSEYAMNKAVGLAKSYRDASMAMQILNMVTAEGELRERKAGTTPEMSKLITLNQQLKAQQDMLKAQQALGADEAANSKLSATIARTQMQILDSTLAVVDAKAREKDLQTELTRAGEPELLIKQGLLVNERQRLSTLQAIEGSHQAQQQSLNRIKQMENEILAIQTAQSNQMMDSALGNLASFAPGIDQMTGSLNNLSMSFNNMGQSSMTATQMVSSGLQAFQGLLSYSSNMSIQAVDAQINAEKKRDGKSKESVAKIAALEKKKINEQKKSAKQQILISTAVAVMNAAANPWPMPAIPLMAAAALAGGLAYSQAASASSNMVSGAASGSNKASLSIGERDNKVDVSQNASRGELAYMRNESGTGSMQSFTPRANGGIGTPGNSLVVGEHGPEVITPLEPIRAYSAEESRKGGGSGGYTDNRKLVVNAIDTQSIMDRADDIFDAWDGSARERGLNSDKLYN